MTQHVAREALDLAKDVDRRMDGHEDICAIRYRSLENSIAHVKNELSASVGDIKKVLAWAGGTAFIGLIGALSFFLKVQFDANADMQRSLQNLQQHQGAYERPHQGS